MDSRSSYFAMVVGFFSVGWLVLVLFLWVGVFFVILDVASLHTTHNLDGIILKLSPLEYKYNLSQNMLQVEAIVL